MIIRTTFVLAGLALAASLPAAPAVAQTSPSQTVDFTDLDLRTDAGVGTFDRRLRRAINRVCGPPLGGYLEAINARRCRAETLAEVTPRRDAIIRLARAGQAIQVARLEVMARTRSE
ncbi:UrcA family protein [Aurantiacibacter hainanensis]|uniref:UrcA family protein n=1 Tax=Aurantiacibacter hainanensis TaxID=3076114 RepID=UPI0030C71446